ncbi:MAG: thioesterase domain-containing protein [Halomonas subglaciescola]|nr:thioesterase domain-containing protein [Halomonas subglaciescola]
MTLRAPGAAYPALDLPQGDDDLAAFQAWLYNAIPLAGELGITAMHWQGERLVWELAVAPSLNDKGTGFGGALAAQTTLAGWCWLTLWLRRRGVARSVVIAESSQRFLAPVTGDYRLECGPTEAQATASLSDYLRTRGKGRITLTQTVDCGATRCLEASGRYVVLPAAGS